MPELPEVQALAERLDAAVGRTTLSSLDLLQFSALKTVAPSSQDLTGRTIVSVGRRGKFLVLELDGPRILVHLSQGGRVDLEQPPKVTRPRGAVARLVAEPPVAILIKEYGKERKAGLWLVDEGQEGPLEALGPEPDSENFASYLAGADDRRRVHTILRDQRTVAGIGRGYTDDALHAARISPYTSLASMDAQARTALLEAIRTTLAEGLAQERQREGGLPARLGDHWVVHNRAGEPCPRCGADLRRVSYESYEVTYCPPCQTGGKVLADRRLSRLLR